eukprot:c5981_g1_i1.p1 GENE.c5981_g1_i1~~c5981_g1_i1.p1  ORF type:complete len:409 (-),score=119.09 c5981_g1_i1:209-1387(-)
MSTKTRFAIVGLGQMGAEHARNISLLPDAVVTTIVDPHPQSLNRLAQLQHSGALSNTVKVLQSVDEFLNNNDNNNVDAIIICTPNNKHSEILRKLLPQNMNILVEKPLCTTKTDCLEITELAKKSKGILWVGMEYRYMLPVARMVQEIHTGVIGDIKMLSIREHRFPFLVKVENWNRFSANTGGTMVEKCCHFFDLMRLITQSEPVSVFCSGAQSVNHLSEKYNNSSNANVNVNDTNNDDQTPDIIDNSFTVVVFENGCRAMLDLCMFAEVSRNQEELSACGPKGKIEATLPDANVFIGLRDPSQPITDQPPAESHTHHAVQKLHMPVDTKIREAGFHEGSVYFELQRFIKATRGEGAVEVTVNDGTKAVLMGIAAEMSIKENRVVRMSELW